MFVPSRKPLVIEDEEQRFSLFPYASPPMEDPGTAFVSVLDDASPLK